MRRLPPLNALRAFEAAARHMSFKKAADELNVTPAAVSHQVKALEGYLDRQLFRRLNNALALTAAGARYLPLLTEGFDKLAEAGTKLAGDTGGYAIDRLAHSLQSATRAQRDGWDDEYVVCALVHDIGEVEQSGLRRHLGVIDHL